jgi:hypothetical protein
MASVVGICNAALQKLGAERINDLLEDSANARSCNAAYERLRDAELRAHPWRFAMTRASLPADADAPEFGKARSFPLPDDWLRMLPPYPEMNMNDLDWEIEGRSIYTNDSAPLDIRYIRLVEDPNEMDALFREALAARMAHEMCEEITQSNTKQQLAADNYKNAIREARRTNAIESISAEPPTDTWETCRA